MTPVTVHLTVGGASSKSEVTLTDLGGGRATMVINRLDYSSGDKRISQELVDLPGVDVLTLAAALRPARVES